MTHKSLLLLLIVCTVGLTTSCKYEKRMTQKEIEIIKNGEVDNAFRVLEIGMIADSIVLRKKSINVDFKRDSVLLSKLIARMKITMEAESGVGIAAPQIGVSRNVFLFTRIDKPGLPVEVAINPVITRTAPETICFERDGCLSVPGESGNSVRFPWIEVEYINEFGVLVKERIEGFSREEDFTAIIFQHEFDHLQGILYIDKLFEEKN